MSNVTDKIMEHLSELDVFFYRMVNGTCMLAEEIEISGRKFLSLPFRLEFIGGTEYRIHESSFSLIEYSTLLFDRRLPIPEKTKIMYFTLCAQKKIKEMISESEPDFSPEDLENYLDETQNPSLN